MLKVMLSRLRQGGRTLPCERFAQSLPDRFLGSPVIDSSRCPRGCEECLQACPTDAICRDANVVSLDLGRCLFCGQCQTGCPEGAVRFTREHRLAASTREDLVRRAGQNLKIAQALALKIRHVLGRSLKLRQVSAGGCNGCEAELNALGNVVFDLGRFGIQFVASPRHADGLLITGPVTQHMRFALEETYRAVPSPKIVVAVGACAISGGPYAGHEEVHNGVEGTLPVDLYVPGCPPHPVTILDGLLRLLGRPEGDRALAKA